MIYNDIDARRYKHDMLNITRHTDSEGSLVKLGLDSLVGEEGEKLEPECEHPCGDCEGRQKKNTHT